MSLLPSSDTDVDARQEGDIRVHGIDDDRMSDVLDAISSDTAREILGEVYATPATASEIAQRTDGSVQNVSYHLDKLEDAGAIMVVDTQYSEKGREMKIYGPADEPVVLFVGTEERQEGLMSLLKRFLGAIGVVIVTSYLIGYYIEDSLLFGIHSLAAGGRGPDLPIALAFLVGGLFTLVVITLWTGWRWYRTSDT